MNENSRFFSETLMSRDPVIASEIALEFRRQQAQIELIASENLVSAAVLEAQGSVLPAIVSGCRKKVPVNATSI